MSQLNGALNFFYDEERSVSRMENLYLKDQYLAFKSMFEATVHSGQLTTALKQIESLLNQYEDHPGIYYLAGILFFHHEDFVKAKKYVEKSAFLDAGNQEYLALLGCIHVELKEFSEAEAVLTKSYEMNSDCLTTLVGLGKLAYLTRNQENAVHYLQKAFDIEPTHLEAIHLLGKVYLQDENRVGQAIELLEKAKTLGASYELDYDYARALYLGNETSACLKHCKKFLLRNPNSAYTDKFRDLIYKINHSKSDEPRETVNKTEQRENKPSNSTEKSMIDQYQEIFKEAEVHISKHILGQEKFIADLSHAFMRSVVYQRPDVPVKNVIFISGKRGMGIRKSIQYLTAVMKEYDLFTDSAVEEVDLARSVNGANSENLFLTDVYRGLSSRAEVVVFDQVDKCPPQFISKLSELMINGRIRLKDRYIYNDRWKMLEKTNSSLAEESISELEGNNKLIILVSNKEFKDIRPLFPATALEKLRDNLQAEFLTKEIRVKIAQRYLNKYIKRISDKLQIGVSISEDVKEFVADQADFSIGVHGIKAFIEDDLYQSLTELRMIGNIQPGMNYKLIVQNKELLLDDDFEQIVLTRQKVDSENLEAIRAELDKVIGLNEVKEKVYQLEEYLSVQKLRASSGAKGTRLSMHMIFTGNPGTGKTTIARLVAQYLKALGYLSSGHLVEVDRGKLVASYVGQTAPKTQAIVDSAKGGVLFIDEAYSLARGGKNDFGKEAIDTLVKGMEDLRDDLVVILAGYQNEMEEFLKTNPGLRSRFANQIQFNDYQSEELYQIAEKVAEGEGYKIDSSCHEGLIEEFERKQIPGKNDAGNGRLARNVVEAAIAKQSSRILTMMNENGLDGEDVNLLTISDFGLDAENDFDLDKELEKIVGLKEVKDLAKRLQKQLIAQQKRKKSGITMKTSQNLSMIFTGNPGTGKTTVARILGSMMKEMGVLKSGQIVEVDRGDLVAPYVGQTAPKTRDKFMSALGGILFIDEAYALSTDSFGKEAIDTLVKLMEDHRENVIVILAGYEKEMKEFLKSNSGLKSRFPQHMHFEDYSVAELVEIGEKVIEHGQYILTEKAKEAFIERIESEHQLSSAASGNGRLVRNIVEEAIRKQSERIALDDTMEATELMTFMPSDFLQEKREKGFDLEVELEKIIGLTNVKDFVRTLEKQLIAEEIRKSMGIKTRSSQNLNMIFTGNPGTGKTTVARVIGELLRKMGVLKTGTIVEVDRGDLVAQYAGQTPEKVKEVFASAMGGVLFIDEAYTLSTDSMGKEAIDVLVKLIEDHRGSVIVILAGYEKEMDDFLKTNPGLKSRFPIITNFPDYSTEELVEIGKLMVASEGYTVTEAALGAMAKCLERENKRSSSDAGNGRLVRNVMEKAIRSQSSRVVMEGLRDPNKIVELVPEDFIKEENEEKSEFDLESKLNAIIGLDDVKQFMKSLQAQIHIQQQRKKLGLPVDEGAALHMIFTGNPGTGKTTVAKLVGELLYDLGILRSNKFIETDRAGLVAGYVGQTAIKTHDVIQQSLGGVLFIDEAYTLSQDQNSANGFGKEAIDTLLKDMEDYRDDLIVILAGYTNEMEEFLNTNPGLRSRFPNIIEFMDYSVDELLLIAHQMFEKKGYRLTAEAWTKLKETLAVAKNEKQFGNGRFIRNLYEDTVRKQAVRLQQIKNLTIEYLTTIEAVDIQ